MKLYLKTKTNRLVRWKPTDSNPVNCTCDFNGNPLLYDYWGYYRGRLINGTPKLLDTKEIEWWLEGLLQEVK